MSQKCKELEDLLKQKAAQYEELKRAEQRTMQRLDSVLDKAEGEKGQYRELVGFLYIIVLDDVLL